MVNRIDIKDQSRAQLAGKVWPILGCSLLIGLVVWISNAANVIPVVGFLVPLFVGSAASLGISQMYLNVTYGDDPKIEDVFSGFKRILPATLLGFLLRLFIALWTLLLVVPGIIMAISYSMSWYIMCENPDMSVMECIEESKSIMKGHKMEYFVMILSFIGWFMLCIVTLGIGYIYVVPYLNLAKTNFYHRIKNTYSADEGYKEIYSERVDEREAGYSNHSSDENAYGGNADSENAYGGNADGENAYGGNAGSENTDSGTGSQGLAPVFPDVAENPFFNDPFENK